MSYFKNTFNLGSFGLSWTKKGLGNTDTLIATAEKELRTILGLAAISMDDKEIANLAAKAEAQKALIALLKAQKEEGPGLLLPPGLLSSDGK